MGISDFFLVNINGILLTVLGWYYFKYPPKTISHFYGYRTRSSMANQEIWDYANKISSKMMLDIGLLVLSTGILLSFFYSMNTVLIITVFMMLIGIGIGMYWCETQLNKRFDKNGNPKKEAS